MKAHKIAPQSFRPQEFVYNKGIGQVRRLVTISDIKVISLASVQNSGLIKMEAYGKVRPWFLLECWSVGWTGARFHLLSDGEEWHAVENYAGGRYKITNDFKPKSSVDLKNLAQNDMEIVREAIKCFLRSKE